MTPAAIRRAYLREAFVAIVLARIAVRLIPATRVFAWANRAPRRISRFATDEANWISWAVEQIATKPWINALCLPRALATHAMLRRRGIASRLCLGVARQDQALIAHAWVEIGEGDVLLERNAGPFTPRAQFGGAR